MWLLNVAPSKIQPSCTKKNVDARIVWKNYIWRTLQFMSLHPWDAAETRGCVEPVHTAAWIKLRTNVLREMCEWKTLLTRLFSRYGVRRKGCENSSDFGWNSSLRDIIIASSEWIAPRKTFLLCCANHNCSMITQCFTCLSFKLQSYLLLRTLCCGSITHREQKTEVFQATTEVVSWTLHSKHLQGYSCHKNVFIFRHLQPASHTSTNK